MKALISLMLVTSIVGAQEVRAPQRGEERREPNKVERTEPVRVHPPVQEERRTEPPRQVEPRPEPPIGRPVPPPVVRPINPPIFLDPWNRLNGPCWNTWECRTRGWNNPQIQLRFDTRTTRRRPSRLEMAPLRQRWDELTPKQQKQLIQARKDFREKVQKILNNP